MALHGFAVPLTLGSVACVVNCRLGRARRRALWRRTLFHITRNIWQGRFASRQRLDDLQRVGITHILNVGESPNQLTERDGPFRNVAWIPVEDLVIIPTDSAIRCIDALHEYVCDGDSNVYIHCVAGWNRSPAVLWLYLIACGIEPSMAKAMIASSSYDAVPAHPRLVNDALVAAVCEHGTKRFRPHPRPTAIDAAKRVEQSHALKSAARPVSKGKSSSPPQ